MWFNEFDYEKDGKALMKPILAYLKIDRINTDTDEKNSTEVSVFQNVFEIRSISVWKLKNKCNYQYTDTW